MYPVTAVIANTKDLSTELSIMLPNIVRRVHITELLYSEPLSTGEKFETLHVAGATVLASVIVLDKVLGSGKGPVTLCGLRCATGLTDCGT